MPENHFARFTTTPRRLAPAKKLLEDSYQIADLGPAKRPMIHRVILRRKKLNGQIHRASRPADNVTWHTPSPPIGVPFGGKRSPGGLGLQFAFAVFVLKMDIGRILSESRRRG